MQIDSWDLNGASSHSLSPDPIYRRADGISDPDCFSNGISATYEVSHYEALVGEDQVIDLVSHVDQQYRK